MGKEEKLKKMMKDRGGLFGEGGLSEEESKDLQVQLEPGQISLPLWGIPPSEEKAKERMGSYRIKGLEQYYKMGKTLLWLKENRTQHGEWGEYLKTELDLDEKSAQRFMAYAKRADDLEHLPTTLVEQKSLPGKAQKAKTTQVSDLKKEPTEEVSELKSVVKDLEAQTKEERKARERVEKTLEEERKAREKAERLAQEAQEKLVKERPAVKEETVPGAEIKPLTVELAPGFNRPKVEKTILDWFWATQGKVKAPRKRILLGMDITIE